jgi:hypothetical protein
MVRAVSLAPKAAAMENPRLMIALMAVMDAQTVNGRVIQPPGGVVFEKTSFTVPANYRDRKE